MPVAQIKREDIEPLIPEGVENVYFTDNDYAMYKPSFLLLDGYKSYSEWLNFAGIKSRNGLDFWRSNWDCDNLAFSYKTYMSMLHAKENLHTFSDRHGRNVDNTSNSESVAVGVIFYKMVRDYGKRGKSYSMHAINTAVTISANGELEMIYIEPKNGQKFNLTQEEQDSIWYVNF